MHTWPDQEQKSQIDFQTFESCKQLLGTTVGDLEFENEPNSPQSTQAMVDKTAQETVSKELAPEVRDFSQDATIETFLRDKKTGEGWWDGWVQPGNGNKTDQQVREKVDVEDLAQPKKREKTNKGKRMKQQAWENFVVQEEYDLGDWDELESQIRMDMQMDNFTVEEDWWDEWKENKNDRKMKESFAVDRREHVAEGQELRGKHVIKYFEDNI